MFHEGYSVVANWGYSENTIGPQDWHTEYAKCDGSQQSPIDIKDGDLQQKVFDKLKLKKYKNKRDGMVLENTGNAIQVTMTQSAPRIKHGGLPDKAYILDHLTFHIGNDSTAGSEHLLNGMAFPAEIQFVHYSTKYGSLKEAMESESSGVAIIGVWVEVGETENPYFAPIIDALSGVPNAGDNVTLSSFSLRDLLPASRQFYCYNGSLTTPPCYEGVWWYILHDTITMSENQLVQLRTMMTSNFRPVQQLNGRNVYSSVTLAISPL